VYFALLFVFGKDVLFLGGGGKSCNLVVGSALGCINV
jgi:hypothetical protein